MGVHNDNTTSEEGTITVLESGPSQLAAGDTISTSITIEEASNIDKNEKEKDEKGQNLETVIDMLTEPQLEPIIAARKKRYWVYFADTAGEKLEYEPGRNEFVRYVFSLVFLMLVTTAVITTAVYIFRPTIFEDRHPLGMIILIVCCVITICVGYAFMCCDCARYGPVGYVLLAIGTLGMSVIVAIICMRYAPFIVLGATLATAATVGVCLGLAYTSFDFTKFMLIVIVASFALAFAGLLCVVLKFAFGLDTTFAKFIITCISAVVSSVMLVIEFQMILGGKSVELSEDEYVFAAWMLYTSIIDLFLKFLAILAHIQGEG